MGKNILKKPQNKGVNQTRNERGLVFNFGLFARWLRMAF
jgi:hypothetical protein